MKPANHIHNNSQRIISVARVARGLRQIDLADLMYRSKEEISGYERGIYKAPWDEIYRVMPEVEDMREKGCAAYCPMPTACRIGRCIFDRKGRPRKELQANVVQNLP